MTETKSTDERRGATSASSAQADLLCPGRFNAQKGIPETTSEDAAFGRAIHQALAAGSTDGLNSEQLSIHEGCQDIETKLKEQFFGPDASQVKTWREQRYWCKVDRTLEHSAQPDVVHRHGPKLLVLEYKTLPGDVPGSASNLQLRDQVVLVAGNLVANEVGCAVIQPLVTYDPEICLYTAEQIKRSEQEMFERVRNSNQPDAPRTPGEVQCKYCRAKNVCQSYQMWAGSQVPEMSSILDVPVSQWTPEQRAVFCDKKSIAQKWLDECEAEMKRLMAEDPEAVPGWTLKEGAQRELITDPQELFNRFNALGGTIEQFMACVGVTKGKLEGEVRAVTKTKGKGLKSQMDGLLKDITESKQNAPSLARRKP